MTYRDVLRKYWGYDDFRGIQAEIIGSIGRGDDTLGLMPTGGGKSLTFQIPALTMDGVCIVITPLIALMKDQVANLRKRGIHAAAIYSGMERNDIIETLENCIFGGCKFLYVSPERLSSPLFLTKLSHMKVCLLAVDEAHCISQWGFDFRPAYLEIAAIRELLPGTPVLALTATATEKVADDIQERLGFRKKNLIRMSFDRENLWYMVRDTDDKQSELIHILKKVNGSGIVYVRSRKEAGEISDLLNGAGITSCSYHAGLEACTKEKRQKDWTEGRCRIMSATNAFGMGIDKADVRIVIHMSAPDSPEAYFQEAGRAGRDGATAYAVLLHSPGDKRVLSKRISDAYPEKDFIRKVYEYLAYYYEMAVGDGLDCAFEFSLQKFCSLYSLPAIPVESALRILTRAGYIEYIDETDYSARLQFTMSRDELYSLRSDNAVNERILCAILRMYSGVFTEQVYLDENALCIQAATDRDTLYRTLTGWSKSGVLHYIPSRKTPMIRWKRERIASDRICFSPEIYEYRRKEYAGRIGAITDYMTRRNGCRNEILLNYFGEKRNGPCNRCDLCRSRKQSELPREIRATVHNEIVRILSDPSLPQGSVYSLPYGKEQIDRELELMLNEEEICMENGKLRMNSTERHGGD